MCGQSGRFKCSAWRCVYLPLYFGRYSRNSVQLLDCGSRSTIPGSIRFRTKNVVFQKTSGLTSWPTQLLILWVAFALSPVVKRPYRETTHLYSVKN